MDKLKGFMFPGSAASGAQAGVSLRGLHKIENFCCVPVFLVCFGRLMGHVSSVSYGMLEPRPLYSETVLREFLGVSFAVKY